MFSTCELSVGLDFSLEEYVSSVILAPLTATWSSNHILCSKQLKNRSSFHSAVSGGLVHRNEIRPMGRCQNLELDLPRPLGASALTRRKYFSSFESICYPSGTLI